MSCSVKCCRSVRRLLIDNSISFHRFPKTGELLNLWLKALNIFDESWKWAAHKFVCSKHFQPEDFVETGSFRRLKTNAVPTLCLKETTEQLESSLGSSFGATPSRKKHSQDASTSFDQPATSSSSNAGEMETLPRVARGKRKRKLNLPLQMGTSSSSSSSSKRKRVQLIKSIHSYSASPSTLMKKNLQMRQSMQRYRKKLYDAKRKATKLQQKVTSMKSVINFLQKNDEVSDNGLNHISKSVSDVPSLLMARYLKNLKNETVTHESYPAPLRQFAATLQFYSSKAYEVVCKQFDLALPHQNTIRRWFSHIDCSPGFLLPAFNTLKQKVEEASHLGREVICSLVFDEMSIKKQIEFDGKRMWGYIDTGVPIENDQLEPASEVLMVTVVSHLSSWKIPVAYFFIKSLSGKEKANIVKECLIRLHQVGVKVTSVTCDGPSGNFTMMEELGGEVKDINNLKTSFPHPETQEEVYCILDPCHMLKLCRNLMADLDTFKDPTGKNIRWYYIKRLQEIQEEETLHIGTKLRRTHVEWTRQKMKVSLAAQTLSRSVADALRFLRLDVKHPDFKDSEATEEFIIRIDRLFDLLNSKSPYAKGTKACLRLFNEKDWRPFFTDTIEYLINCADVAGRPIWATPKKTAFKGFCITIKSVCGIFDKYVKSGRMRYLLTFKISQDHQETLFCAIRSRNGWNNNPSCLQVMYALRRLLLHTRVGGEGGNCRLLDSTVVLSVPSTATGEEDTVDLSLLRKYGMEPQNTTVSDMECDVIDEFIPLTEISANVVAYIAGFVMRMLLKKRICSECYSTLVADNCQTTNTAYQLIHRKNRGGLIVPSESVVEICENTELTIRKLMESTNNKIPKEKGFQQAFVIAVSQKFYPKIYVLFPKLANHFLEAAPFEENHGFILVKNIVSAYSRIRFFNLAKTFTMKIQGPSVRRHLNKIILFNHQ